MPQFFDRYIRLVSQEALSDAFIASRQALEELNEHELEALGEKTYAPGKWTVKDILQHLIDNERIQAYRALRIARQDPTPLPGYEENLLAQHAGANRRSVAHLIEELDVVRTSTEILFNSFNEEALLSTGTCFNQSISALALGFVIVGHQQHHLDVLRRLYMPLLS